jgi:phosphatidylserine/phosphatidylglycerophosphate/cardiolipin synthase-like enzyme
MIGAAWWVLALAGIGLAAIAGVVITLFTSLGRRPQALSVTMAPRVGTDDFLHAVAGTVNAPLVAGGHARVLNNGVEIFPAMLAAFERAERSINLMTYIWEAGEASSRVLEVLTRKALEGVEVRVMLDSMGGSKAPDEGLRRLRDAGGRVERFRQFRLGKISRFHKRNHRRAIVVDGCVGFTGGASIGDEWLGDAHDEEHWRDLMVEVHGDAARYLQSGFAQLWAESCGEILAGPAYYPPEPDVAEGIPEGFGTRTRSSTSCTSRPSRTPTATGRRLPGAPRAARLRAGPRRGRHLAPAVLPLAAARRRVRHRRLLQHPPVYGNIEDFQRFLEEAHRRGLRVIADLVLNHTSATSTLVPARAARSQGLARARLLRLERHRRAVPDARIIFTDTEPSNWTWDPVAEQYYWHRFFAHQPDLNWDNPEVKEKMFEVMEFWLDKGLDGFRADAVPYLIEREGTICENLPETHDILKEFRTRLDAATRTASCWPRPTSGPTTCAPTSATATSSTWRSTSR